MGSGRPHCSLVPTLPPVLLTRCSVCSALLPIVSRIFLEALRASGEVVAALSAQPFGLRVAGGGGVVVVVSPHHVTSTGSRDSVSQDFLHS